MMTVIIACLIVLIACMAVALYRLIFGHAHPPEDAHGSAHDAVNRLLAFDLMGVLLSLALALVAIVEGSWVYLEISMGLAVLAVVATVAIAHFIERGRIF